MSDCTSAPPYRRHEFGEQLVGQVVLGRVDVGEIFLVAPCSTSGALLLHGHLVSQQPEYSGPEGNGQRRREAAPLASLAGTKL